MSNYTKTTNFAAKDSLPSGNAAKIVKGTEIDTEFNNIATASATKANSNNAALTGTTVFETLSDGTLSITGWVDEDNMSSDSASLVPTQQSVKAYVDSQVTAQDLDVTDGSTSIDIDLDSESLGILGGTGIDSTASGTGVTLAIDATVATLAGTQTLSNKTLSTPVVSGNLTTDGLVDGRDVATDGAKLDGIESGATADQTAAEIKTAYESNADTNAFTDADHSKLDGIEASADVTDTANVTAAGALMDSELTSEASVKALNQGVATTDSPTFAGVTAPITGNVTGNLTGNVTGNVTGDLTGDVTGDVTGNVTGNLTGSVLTAAQTNITSVGTLGALTVTGDVTVDTNSLKVDSTNNRVGILNASPDVTLDVGSATDAMHVPVGTTAQRPGSPAAGYFRYNSTTGGFEGYTDAWGAIAGGGGGVAPSIDTMTGDGSDTTLALTNAPVNENATFVTIDGVTQHKSTYSVSGTTLTFSTAPPTGSAVEAITLNTTTINTASILQDADGDTKVQVEESSDEDKIRFDTAGTERMIIDSTGVGIGTSSPSRELEVTGSGNVYIKVTAPTASDSSGIELANTGGTWLIQNDDTSSEALTFDLDGSEAMRIDASGNALVGRTSRLTSQSKSISSDTVMSVHGVLAAHQTNAGILQYSTNDNSFQLRAYGATAGTGIIKFLVGGGGGGADSEAMRIDASRNLLVGKTSSNAATPGHELKADGAVWHTADSTFPLFLNRETNDGELIRFRKDNSDVGSIGTQSTTMYIAGNSTENTGIRFYNVGVAPCTNAGAYIDNARDLGSSSVRWDDIYATNGTIQTSDRNEKQDIEALSDAEQRVAVAAKGLLRKFRWISSVEENGDDARIHFGIIAQDLQDAFTAEGLDAGRYAMFISSTWTDEDTGEERTRLGVRYSELLAFIISAI